MQKCKNEAWPGPGNHRRAPARGPAARPGCGRGAGRTTSASARSRRGRTAAAVTARWKNHLENRQPDRNGAAWNPEDDAVIVDMNSRLETYDAIAKELGRTTLAVQARWYKLKSLPPKRSGAAWTPEDDEFIVDAMARGDTYAAIARELGRTTQAVHFARSGMVEIQSVAYKVILDM